MKKIIAVLITLILSLQMTVVFAIDSPNVAVGTASGKAGDTVSVDVVLSNNVNFTNLSIEVDYDSSVLTLQSAVGDNGVGIAMIGAQALTTRPYNMAWDSSPNDSTYNGNLVKLTFKIADNAEAGTYPITVSYYKGTDKNFVDGVNVNFAMDWVYTFGPVSIGLTYTSGAVTVESDAPVGPTLSATCTDGKNVAVTATGVEAGGKFIAALYDGNEMTDMAIADAAATATLTFLEGTGDNVKVFWWDGLTTLAPVATPVEIPLGN